jgi:protein-tyrosine phosphatase
MPTIIFVCTANRYRSPMAAACFRRELQRRGVQERWHVLSAGTWAIDGLPAAQEAIYQASRMGLHLAEHASQTITAQLVSAADLIIVMEQGHKEALQAEFPASAGKVYLLSEAATGNAYEIRDPAAMVTDEGVPEQISALIHEGFERICALAPVQRKGSL